ncbi:hypothetical protein BV898_11481 [Hypsibius exemplaris]|uniref:Uncharacterized protein n=1 Tax=Hypsibius exemplaris TaxID=2072580 RepID=A0A1W0WGV8_HYPEX|nr:hypothetical protein BV898_11481 [Hypsibius exemplaris]
MLTQMKPPTEEQFADVLYGKKVASRNFDALLDVTNADKNFLQKRTYSLRQRVTDVLVNVTDSHHRIAENYSMVIAATELFLEKTGYAEWKSKVEPFVLKKLVPNAAPYYKFRTQTKGQISFGHGTVDETETMALASLFCSVIEELLKEDENKVWKCVSFMPLRGFVVVREQEFLPMASRKKENFGVIFDKMKQLPGVETGLQVRYSDEISKRSTGIPKELFTISQIQLLKNDSRAEERTFRTTQDIISTRDHRKNKSTPTTVQELSNLVASSPERSDNSDLEDITEESAPAVSARKPAVSTTRAAKALNSQPRSSNAGGSFTVTNKVANPAPRGRKTGEEQQNEKEPKKRKPECGACNEQKDEPTYPCTARKERFHLECQDTDNKHWPTRTNARGRRCVSCRSL